MSDEKSASDLLPEIERKLAALQTELDVAKQTVEEILFELDGAKKAE